MTPDPRVETAANEAIAARDRYGWSPEADEALNKLRAVLADAAQQPAAREAGPAAEFSEIEDEAYLLRAISVMEDTLTDIEDWEDKELSKAIESSLVDLRSMVECIRMRADPSHVPQSPFEKLATPSPAQQQPTQGVSDEQIDALMPPCSYPRGGVVAMWLRADVIATVRAALAEFGAGVPEGYALLKNTTHAERDWPEDSSHENGNYSNDCKVCLRQFIGHKRRHICKSCSLQAAQRREGGGNG